MANKTIPNLPDYGSQDTDKIKKDLLEITKNDGTYASPSYPTGASRKITLEEFKTALAIETSFIKNIVVKNQTNATLEIDKINWVTLTNDHTMSVPTADVSNLGKIIIVNNRSSSYSLTITGLVVMPMVLTGYNSIIGVVCVTDGVGYGWEVFSRYNVGDFDLISQTITNGVTTKSPSEDAVFDAFALKAPIASPTFTGTVTTPDVIVSGATALTIAHFDASKNIESLPLATYPSLTELSYVKGVTSAIQTQLDARSTAYAIPNYYRVDLNLGDDLTGVAGREDKPYRLIQTVWDLIPTSSTAQITIEIVGDFTFTTHALLTSVAKDNITFLFKGKIVYAVPATTTSRPLFTFTGTNNNLTFIVPNYTQTTLGGFVYASLASGFKFIFENCSPMMGISTTSVNNYGFYVLGTTLGSYFICKSLILSISSGGSSLLGYRYPLAIGNCNYDIASYKVTGTSSVANTKISLFGGAASIIKVDNLSCDISYTNVTGLNICASLTCDNVLIQNLQIASNGSTQKNNEFALFTIITAKNVSIMSGSILNYSMITDDVSNIQNLNLGELIINGLLNYNYSNRTINLFGNITKNVASQAGYAFINLAPRGQLNGNGFKIFYTDATYISNSAIVTLTSSAIVLPKAILLNNVIFYNTAMPTGNVQAFVPVQYYFTELITLRLCDVIFLSNLDTNTHANTTPIRPYSENTSYMCRVEGNVTTNYLKNITNLTNDCDIDLINGYTL